MLVDLHQPMMKPFSGSGAGWVEWRMSDMTVFIDAEIGDR